jgi:hypothetical protein
MSVEQVIGSMQFAPFAGADLTGKLHYFVKLSADFTVVLATAGTEAIVGVIREEANIGKPVTVQYGGMGKAIAGGAITVGQRITSDSNGKAVATAVGGDIVVGLALMNANVGDIFTFLFVPGQV